MALTSSHHPSDYLFKCVARAAHGQGKGGGCGSGARKTVTLGLGGASGETNPFK